MCNFHGFKDNSIVLNNKGKRNQKSGIVSMKDSKIQLGDDGVKRGAVSWEAELF